MQSFSKLTQLTELAEKYSCKKNKERKKREREKETEVSFFKLVSEINSTNGSASPIAQRGAAGTSQKKQGYEPFSFSNTELHKQHSHHR